MKSNHLGLAGNVAVLLLGVLLGALSMPASALDVELPGERKLEIHGFYEMRLRMMGINFPFGGRSTFSQFRHVVDIETELDLLPEGWKVLDSMFFFTRWVFNYECIYQRACGLVGSADSFGGDRRKLNRLPANLRPAITNTVEAGGVFPLRFRPGTLRPIREELNPGFRYRGCENPGGVFANPSLLLGAFCNFENRSRLDGPIDEFATTAGAGNKLTRAGAFNTAFRLSLTRAGRSELAARPALNPTRTRETLEGFGVRVPETLTRFDELQAQVLNNEVLTGGQDGVFRALTAALARESDPVEAAKLQAQADELLKVRQSNPSGLPTVVLGEDGEPILKFDDSENELLALRPDNDVFRILASARAPGLLDSLWGASRLKDFNLPYLATLDTPLEPLGYFGSEPLDLVPEYAAGFRRSGTQLGTIAVPPGLEGSAKALSEGALPFLVGPDGLRNTADDLPRFVEGAGLVREDLSQANETRFNSLNNRINLFSHDEVVFHRAASGAEAVFYARWKQSDLLKAGCDTDGGEELDGAQCFRTLADGSRADVTARALTDGCRNRTVGFSQGGINEEGDCIDLLMGALANDRPFGSVFLLQDLSLRPGDSTLEPVDLTDFQVVARGHTDSGFARGLPARPRNSKNSMYFQNQGVQRLVAQSSHLVSALDLDFSEDNLRWGHGASEDEHEFAEGYLEFELFDGNFYMKAGKLLTVWGKTELFRNQDRLNPLNISNGPITRLEESRIGQWMIDLVYSPESWMRVGPVEDMRLELVVVFDDFQPIDLGKCGENSALAIICLKSFGAMASGLAGLGLVGEVRPDTEYGGLKRFDYGIRLEGRWDRFTFAITDFWGWDDVPYLDQVFQYGRSVDELSGAPLAVGGGVCRWRAADGSAIDDPTLGVGPDGRAETLGDNDVATVGNCLLWKQVANGTTQQTLRDPSVIASLHTVNQTLFHTVCTLTFDRDNGRCALDSINSPEFFQFVSAILGGDELIGALALSGFRRIRLENSPFDIERPVVEVNTQLFSKLNPTSLSGLTTSQQALLACGKQFASPCGKGEDDLGLYVDDGALVDIAEGRLQFQISGGPDLMNADASVVTQEFSLLREGSPGALVGMRTRANGSQYFEAGISRDNVFTGLPMSPSEVVAFGQAGREEIEAENVRRQNQNLLMADLRAQATAGLETLDPNTTAQQINDFLRSSIPGYDPTFDTSDEAAGIGGGAAALQAVATDAWIEALPWLPNPELLEQGILVYDIANQNKFDPRCTQYPEGDPQRELFDPTNRACFDDELEFIDGKFNDPTDPTNPLNRFRRLDGDDPNSLIIGESCIPGFGDLGRAAGGIRALAFDAGCTGLEIATQNLERLITAFEIIGPDGAHDPPETVQEVNNVLSGNFELAIELPSNIGLGAGDPIAGPDGIFAPNIRTGMGNAFLEEIGRGPQFEEDEETGVVAEVDLQVVRFKAPELSLGAGLVNLTDFHDGELEFYDVHDPAVVQQATLNFVNQYDPGTCTSDMCFLILGPDNKQSPVDLGEVASIGRDTQLVAVLPISARLPAILIDEETGQITPFGDGLVSLNLMALKFTDPVALAKLFVAVDDPASEDDPILGQHFVEITDEDGNTFFVSPNLGGGSTLLREKFLNEVGGTFRCLDLDQDDICDLDRDGDSVPDFFDDYTAGPITDDNILCGSGLPGDILQDAIQIELYKESEERAFAEQYPNGLPPRSPVFCRSLVGLLGATGQTLPIRRAGGDSSFGRRDFLWHGGQQVVLRYQKRNVFGFALDFAEDVTKTSWGIEFTWTANKLFGDLNSLTSLNQSDEAVLSISVDRPTFINYLNPNRSFFLNFQFFIRYLSDFSGSEGNQDGMFGVAEGPLDGLAVFTFFTGYFQDRLLPRASFVYSPTTSNGGVLSQIQYRWTESFSSTIGLNHFFGRPSQVQQAYAPISLRTDSDTNTEALLRGLAPVRNEDFAFLTIRYSF